MIDINFRDKLEILTRAREIHGSREDASRPHTHLPIQGLGEYGYEMGLKQGKADAYRDIAQRCAGSLVVAVTAALIWWLR